MIGEAFAWAMSRLIAALVIVSFLAGSLAVWGLPKLWAFIKPWIHQVTA